MNNTKRLQDRLNKQKLLIERMAGDIAGLRYSVRIATAEYDEEDDSIEMETFEQIINEYLNNEVKQIL